MKNLLAQLPRNIQNLIRDIGQEAEKFGVESYLVGGFVRDLILGKPNLDVDIVIEGDAIKFVNILARKYKAQENVYHQFGTATLNLPDGLRVDFATARKELYPFSGALPVVDKSNIHEDLFRRDFTINAMALGINPRQYARLVDDFGGLGDLKGKKIRILHEKSFIDDPTRILRAVRFEQRLHFKIEQETGLLLKSALRTNVVSHVKPQRYFAEFKKMLQEPEVKRCISRLAALGGLRFLDGQFQIKKSHLKEFESIKKNRVWFREKFQGKKLMNAWVLYFAVLLEEMSAAKVNRLLERFNLKKEERTIIVSCRQIDVLRRRLGKGNKPSAFYSILKPLGADVIIFLRSKMVHPKLRRRIDDFLVKHDQIRLHVTGDDLQHLGILPGRQLGDILDKILREKIDGKIKSRSQEIGFAKQLIT